MHSDHPLAEAVVKYAEERGVDFTRAKTIRLAPAVVRKPRSGHHYFVGNHRFTHELAVCSDAIENVLAGMEEQGQSVVVVVHKPHADYAGEVLGIIAVGDTMRPNTLTRSVVYPLWNSSREAR